MKKALISQPCFLALMRNRLCRITLFKPFPSRRDFSSEQSRVSEASISGLCRLRSSPLQSDPGTLVRVLLPCAHLSITPSKASRGVACFIFYLERSRRSQGQGVTVSFLWAVVPPLAGQTGNRKGWVDGYWWEAALLLGSHPWPAQSAHVEPGQTPRGVKPEDFRLLVIC